MRDDNIIGYIHTRLGEDPDLNAIDSSLKVSHWPLKESNPPLHQRLQDHPFALVIQGNTLGYGVLKSLGGHLTAVIKCIQRDFVVCVVQKRCNFIEFCIRDLLCCLGYIV